jgi:hypothetical protein
VWLAILVSAFLWAGALLNWRHVVIGPRRVARWLVRSWLSRSLVLMAWAVTGWHLFCQRPCPNLVGISVRPAFPP